MDFIYLNSNRSGIGDRLIDLILVYTFAKFNGYNNIYLTWIEDKQDMISNNSIHTIIRREKTPFREKDYLLVNLLNFIILPDDIIFVSEKELNEKVSLSNNFVFNEYMGLKYSVFTFVNKFLNTYSEEDKNNFINIYYDNYSKIKFKNIPDDIINTFKFNNIITIHLRRSDKVVNDNGDSNGILVKDLEKLNNITIQFVEKCIEKGFKNICFVSDEKIVKKTFINLFENKCNIINFDGDDISQTYYDLYCISNSKKILMSQNFSVFSIIGSLIGKNTLYYIYNSGLLVDRGFNNYNNFISYENL